MDSAEDCQNIHAAASAHLTALEPYGVTAASLTDLNAKIEAYAASLPQPRASIVTGKTATKTLREEFLAADCQSAIRQIHNLGYDLGASPISPGLRPVAPNGSRLYRGLVIRRAIAIRSHHAR